MAVISKKLYPTGKAGRSYRPGERTTNFGVSGISKYRFYPSSLGLETVTNWGEIGDLVVPPETRPSLGYNLIPVM